MSVRLGDVLRAMCLIAGLFAATVAVATSLASWRGVLRDDAGKPVGSATIELKSVSSERHYTTKTLPGGEFAFFEIAAGDYAVSVESGGKSWGTAKPSIITIKDGAALTSTLQVSSQAPEVRVLPAVEAVSVTGSGGEHLSSGEVSSLPLNARDFSKLLLLAAGTMTDTNGAATLQRNSQ
jgi:hypothetical protein